MAKFFWKDKSGRGFTNTFESDEDLIAAFYDKETEEHEESYNGETIEEWLSGLPDEGDEWENRSSKVTRIE